VNVKGNRIEVTADFTPDPGLMAATTALIVGIVREVIAWPSYRTEELQARGIPNVTGVAPGKHATRNGWVTRNFHYPRDPFATPFARLQGSTASQAGFTETGANSLDLAVAGQTTNSLRSVLGAQLGAGIDAGWRDKLNLVFRLGWSHEYADLSRPVTASFAGAPALGFTTYGAVAPRDGVILGLGASTAIAEGTSLYLRYDGELGSGTDNHALTAGLRMSW